MSLISNAVIAYLAFLCRLFAVTPDGLRQGRRGNQPPAQGATGPVPAGW